jgi:glutamine amidotransferase
MCRHLVYLGPPVTLASLVLEPTHSLYEQSWAPTDMRGGGTVNADGFGLAWFTTPQQPHTPAPLRPLANPTPSPPAAAAHPTTTAAASAAHAATGPAAVPTPSTSTPPASPDVPQPVRYRRNVPIWADDNLPGLAGSIRSGAVIAAVRNGTVGMPLGESAVAPFQSGDWFFSHNGMITGWPDSTIKLAERLPVGELLRLDAPTATDSALLWALIQQRLSDGTPPADVVAAVVQEVEAAAPGSRMNVLLTDGKQLIATTWTHSLWVRRTADSITVSSEPFGSDNGDGWDEVPDYSLLVATATTLSITPMEGP